MKNKTKVVPAVTPMKYTPQQFADKYTELCKEMGFQIAFEPRWAQSKDTGDFRLVIVSNVVPMNDSN